MHPRVVNVRAKGAFWDLYVGRGPCPVRGEAGRTPYGNPFPVAVFGHDAMPFFFRWLAGERFTVVGATEPHGNGPELVERARLELPGLVLACWCAPRLCHGEGWARIADGEALEAIRADMLARLPARQGELFRG
jgi:hypothetical protein